MKSFRNTHAVVLASSFLLLLLLQEGSAAPRCSVYDLPPPSVCKYGTAKDWCRNGVCAKGPGERCGGYQRWDGVCGEGTFCNCGVCGGCSPFDGVCANVVLC